MNYKIRNKIDKDWQGKPFVEATLESPTGEQLKVSAWAGEFNGVDEVELELEKNDKGYWRIRKPKMEKPNFLKANAEVVSKSVEKAQEVKAKNIAQAQDRSAWMWAKTNATTIITSSNLKDGETSSAEEMVDKMLALATKIYNGEPEPF